MNDYHCQMSSQISNFRFNEDNCQMIQSELLIINEYRKKRKKNSDVIKRVSNCISLAKKLKCDFSIGFGHELLGSFCYDEGLMNTSVEEYKKAVVIFKKLNRSKDLARVHNKLGVAYTFQGKYDLGLNSHLLAKSILDGLNLSNSEEMADVYTNLATVYEEESRVNEVKKYLHLALKIYERTKNIFAIADVYNNYGKYYFNKEKNCQLAKKYYEKSFQIKIKFPESISLAVTSFNLGLIYLEFEKDLEKAISCFSLTKSISEKFNNSYYLGMALQGLGEIARKKKDYNNSEKLLLKAVDIQKKVNSLPELNMCYESLYLLYFDKGSFKESLKYKLMQVDIKNSIYNQQKTLQFLELEKKYKGKDEQKKIELIKRDQKLKDLKIKNNHTVFTIVCVLFLFAFLCLWLYFRNLNKNKLLLLENKNAKVKVAALGAQINSHFIANTLVSIKNYLKNNDIRNSEKVMDTFSKLMRNVLVKSQHELVTLQEDVDILKEYLILEEINHSHSFKSSIVIDDSIQSNAILLPPMLVQPIIENAIKHGSFEGMGKVQIHYRIQNSNLLIVIEDNGPKIELNSTNEPKFPGGGTRIVKERLELYNQMAEANSSLIYSNLHPLGNRVEVLISLKYDRN
jgi:tetratricopeptide (TPR) repeat protein